MLNSSKTLPLLFILCISFGFSTSTPPPLAPFQTSAAPPEQPVPVLPFHHLLPGLHVQLVPDNQFIAVAATSPLNLYNLQS